MEKKLRITLPIKVLEVLESDIEEFGIKKNWLLNKIFFDLKDIPLNRKRIEGNTDIVQFTLNKQNQKDYYFFLEEKGIQNEAEFFREIITYYSEKSKKERELFIFSEIVERVRYAIEERKVIKIVFKDLRETSVEAYYLGSSNMEVMNYLFSYDLLKNEWKNYKLKNIDKVHITKEKFRIRDIRFVENVKNDFDPFLSKGKRVKIKLTEKGKKLFREMATNRPKVIEREEDIFLLECSEEKAKRYFSFFLDEVEIVEPIELRKWFKEKLEKALKKYD